MRTRTLPEGWAEKLPSWDADPKGVATRKASGEVLAALYPELPELWGGSADLAESNNTAVKGEPSFLPADRQTKMWTGGPYGRTLHFGVREHAMGSIMNGIALHGGTRVYGGTFLTFSDYMRGAVRLAALMQLPVTYVWTHDSIGLGEDGPTHQPIEHFAALRAIPGLDFVRPADANETAVAWRTILRAQRPPGRPGAVPAEPAGLRPHGESTRPTAWHAARTCWPRPSNGSPEVILHRHRLRGADRRRRPRAAGGRRRPDPGGLDAVRRVVRRPGPGLPGRGAAAVGPRPGQRRGRRARWAGASSSATPAGSSASTHYGASAAYDLLYEKFGLTDEAVVAAARESIEAAKSGSAVPAGPVAATGGLPHPTGDR